MPSDEQVGAIYRFKKWWRHKFSFRWVDEGDQWREYDTRWQTDHAANIGIEICQRQVHADTGETRVSRMHYIGITEPIEKFDSEGWFHPDPGKPVRPSMETEPVTNPNRDPPENSSVVKLGGDSDE